MLQDVIRHNAKKNNNFLNIVITIWNEGVFGINFNNIALGIFILLLFVIFRSLFSKIEGNGATIMGLPIKQIKEYLENS